MTVLTAVQSAASSLGLSIPDQVFASTDREMVEMRAVLAETAQQIVDTNEWSALQRFHTITGDGVTETFTLPPDYDRMAKNSQIWSSDMPQGPLQQVGSLDDWLSAETQEINSFYGRWLLQGSSISFRPILPNGETAKFAYYSRNIAIPSTGASKAAFSADTDSFILPERLLTLGIIWNWKARKGLDYSEEMANFQEALAREVTRDKGPGAIITSRRRHFPLPPYGYPR